MADGTKIEWTSATWNVVNGCSVVSPGCTNCYAMRLAGTRMRSHPTRQGLTVPSKAGPVWNGQVRFVEQILDQPLRWAKPRMIFVCAHGDLFHEAVPDEWIDRVFAVMALAPQHTFQVLTKRPDRARRYLTHWPEGMGRIHWVSIAAEKIMPELRKRRGQDSWVWELQRRWPLPNVWLGTSVEDQARADERIPILLDTPAAVRWISAEPLLGPVDLSQIIVGRRRCQQQPDTLDALTGEELAGHGEHAGIFEVRPRPRLDWVVIGGESGLGARPFHIDWARDLIRQCRTGAVPAFMKQLGADPYYCPNNPEPDDWHIGDLPAVRLQLRDPKGGDPDEWPEELRVREWPGTPTPAPAGIPSPAPESRNDP